jgi:hypothetical protein
MPATTGFLTCPIQNSLCRFMFPAHHNSTGSDRCFIYAIFDKAPRWRWRLCAQDSPRWKQDYASIFLLQCTSDGSHIILKKRAASLFAHRRVPQRAGTTTSHAGWYRWGSLKSSKREAFMPTTFSDEWRSNHDRNRRATFKQRSSQDHKHLKAVVGVILFIVIGFGLGALHPLAHTDSSDIHQKTAHAFIRPAN